MLRAARISLLTPQPAQGVLRQLDRLLPLRSGHAASGRIAGIEQVNQGCCQLLGGPSLRLPLDRVPVAFADAQAIVEGPGRLLRAGGPVPPAAAIAGGITDRWGLHWTDAAAPSHPDAMQQRPRSPHPPIRWLHQLAALMAQVARAERLSAVDDGLQARRIRQRMALAQRLLDPLPGPLQPSGWQERSLWTFLRWGGAALLLSLWLRR
jgi:hypothetical protein